MKYFRCSSNFREIPDLYYKYDEFSHDKNVYRYMNGEWALMSLWRWGDCHRKFMFELTKDELFLELV